MEKTYSIIGSMGRTATDWITLALNCHRDVFFVHGFDFEPRKDPHEPYEVRHRRIANAAPKATALVTGPNPQDRYFDIIEKVGDFRVYGTVHSLLPFPDRHATRRTFRKSCVVRNPIERVQSFANKTQEQIANFPPGESPLDGFRRGQQAYIEAMADRHGFDAGDAGNLLFLQSVHTVAFYDDKLRAVARPFRMEDVTGSDACFADFFRYVTRLEPDSDPDFWPTKRGLAPTNGSESSGATALAIFDGWETWQRDVYADTILSFDGLADFYRDLGYGMTPPRLWPRWIRRLAFQGHRQRFQSPM